ncbi:hypothetical protein DPMN_164938 [Dreissena polymorpha]|uniref:Ubiquitin-like domain-containing protein n=1 Tax=Dreissena polymorpha TaxID=45954 RepID=A0A9D4EVX0_DREPO|nr:hypothetical protein DPMN_164938 [Dreissena polymorpha]
MITWYSMAEGQEPLPRKVIEEGVVSKALKVEVYPWLLKVAENSTPDNHVRMQFSRDDTIEQLEVAIRRQFNINEDKEVRIWNRYMTNMYEPLNKKKNTLQDAGLYSGQIVVIEQRNDDDMLSRCRHDGTIPEVNEEELPQHFDIGKHAYVAMEPDTKFRDSEDNKKMEKITPPVYIDDSIDMKTAQSEDPQVQKRIAELERGEKGILQDIETWDVPQERLQLNKGKRKSTYVVPPSSDSEVSDSDMSSHIDDQSEGRMSDNDDTPLAKLIRRRVYERSNSSDSNDDIPLAELKRKYRRKSERMREHERNFGKMSRTEMGPDEVLIAGMNDSAPVKENFTDMDFTFFSNRNTSNAAIDDSHDNTNLPCEQFFRCDVTTKNYYAHSPSKKRKRIYIVESDSDKLLVNYKSSCYGYYYEVKRLENGLVLIILVVLKKSEELSGQIESAHEPGPLLREDFATFTDVSRLFTRAVPRRFKDEDDDYILDDDVVVDADGEEDNDDGNDQDDGEGNDGNAFKTSAKDPTIVPYLYFHGNGYD